MIHQALSIGNIATSNSSNTSIPPGKSLDRWFFDFDASNHMTFNSNIFQHISTLHSLSHIQTANGSSIIAYHSGIIHSPNLSLFDVLLAPQFSMNLIFVGQLCGKGLTITFSDVLCKIAQWGSKLG